MRGALARLGLVALLLAGCSPAGGESSDGVVGGTSPDAASDGAVTAAESATGRPTAGGAPAAAPDDVSGEVAATVNDAAIPMDELRVDSRIAAANPLTQRELEADASGQVRANLAARVLTRRIEDVVIAQSADELDVTVTDADVTEERRELAGRAGGPAALEQRMDELDISEAPVRRLARRLATNEAVESALAQRIDVSDAALRDRYETYFGTVTVRHIVVETEAEARRLRQRLHAGADFATLAREHSLDEETRDDGGRLGTIDRDTAQDRGTAFAEAVFRAEPGLLAPIEGVRGWHVVEVLERDPGPPLAQVADEVRAQVREQRVDDVYDMWVRDHIDAADITVDPSIGTWQPQPARVEPVLVDDRAT